VNESSVKCWVDLGFIACFRTPGGHHKFTAKMVLSFAEQRGFQLDSAVLQELGIATDPVRLSIAKRLDSADSLVPLYRITLCNGPLPVDSSSRAGPRSVPSWKDSGSTAPARDCQSQTSTSPNNEYW